MIKPGYKMNDRVLSSENFPLLHLLCEVLHCPEEEYLFQNEAFLELMYFFNILQKLTLVCYIKHVVHEEKRYTKYPVNHKNCLLELCLFLLQWSNFTVCASFQTGSPFFTFFTTIFTQFMLFTYFRPRGGVLPGCQFNLFQITKRLTF